MSDDTKISLIIGLTILGIAGILVNGCVACTKLQVALITTCVEAGGSPVIVPSPGGNELRQCIEVKRQEEGGVEKQ